MALNVKLLRRVKKHILEEPKRVDMGLFASHLNRRQGGPSCGTVGCIAGWAVLLSSSKKEWDGIARSSGGQDMFRKAAKRLGISYDKAWKRLFIVCGILSDAGTKEQAREVADRIDAFIAAHK